MTEDEKKVELLKEQTRDLKGYMIAEYTDKYCIDDWPSSEKIDIDHLLDLRVFSEEKEVRVFRTYIGRQFSGPVVKDESGRNPEDIMDEVQLLDIADIKETESGKKQIHTVTAGIYEMPSSWNFKAEDNPGIRIRCYFDSYSGSKRAYIKDFRCVGFEKVDKTIIGRKGGAEQ